MIRKLVGNIYLVIILWVGYGVYDKYTSHDSEMAELEKQLTEAKDDIKKKELKVKQLENYFKDVEEAKERIEKVAQGIEKLQRQLPAENVETENVQMLKDVATKLNIKDTSFSPKDEVAIDFYLMKRYSFKATATYLQYLIFFEKIGALERVFNIEEMNMQKSTKKQKGRFQSIDIDVTLTSYRYNPNYKESRGIEDIENKVKNEAKQGEKGKQNKPNKADAKAKGNDLE